jgi:hypothetical protein
LTNLPMEFEKLQSLVELDLSGCSQLRFLPDSIVNMSQLETLRRFQKVDTLPIGIDGNMHQLLVYMDRSQFECLPD